MTPSKPNLERAKIAAYRFNLLHELLCKLDGLPCDVPEDFHIAVEKVNDRYAEVKDELSDLEGE